MKVVLNDRTAGLSPELKEYAQRKLSRLERHFGKVADVEVEFTEEHKRFGTAIHVCRIKVHVDGRRTPVLSAHERGADAQAALDLALDKIDRQVVKLKEKRTNRKHTVSALRVPAEDPGPERLDEPERIRVKLRPQTISEAVEELQADGQNFHVFVEEDSGSIEIAFRRADGSVAVIEPIVT